MGKVGKDCTCPLGVSVAASLSQSGTKGRRGSKPGPFLVNLTTKVEQESASSLFEASNHL